ncbi:MAG: pyruvate kinase, partial [Fimbriimonadaceae bacterium]|nr:pyruvate kinase [Fimbriimonadaceae bacterium]
MLSIVRSLGVVGLAAWRGDSVAVTMNHEMRRHTKIICTMGPAVASESKVKELIAAGMNVARLNCSHGDWESKAQMIGWLRANSDSLGPVAILADLQGPKFRIGTFAGGSLELTAGQSFTLGIEEGVDMPIPDGPVWSELKTGRRALLGDGDVEIRLGEKIGDRFEAKAVTGGTVKNRQGITLVGKSFKANCLTDKDLADVYEACKLGVDFIALSYVQEASDMRELRRVVDRYDSKVRLVAKIETKE